MLRRTSIICLKILIGIVLLIIVGAGMSLWRVSQGPVSISFLLPYVDEILGNTSDPLRPEIDDLIVSWAGWNHAVDVRAVGIKILEQKTMLPIVHIGEASASISVDALMEGKLAPTGLKIIRPIIYVKRTTSGKLKFGIGQKAKRNEEATTEILSLMISELSQNSSRTGKYRYLKRVSFIGTVMHVQDDLNDISWGVPHADIKIERSGKGLRSAFDLELDFMKENLSIEGTADFNRIDRDIIGNFKFKGLNPKALAKSFPEFSQLELLQSNLFGEINFKSTTSGQLTYMKFQVTGGSGLFHPPEHMAPPITFKSIKMVGDFTRNPDRLRFKKLSITTEQISANLKGDFNRIDRDIIGNFKFKGLNPKALAKSFPEFSQLELLQSNLFGEINFKSTTSGQLTYMKFQVTGGSGLFHPPEHMAPPITFKSIKMVGDFTRNPDRLRFKKLSITTEQISANLKGVIKRVKNTALITASITVPSIPVAQLYKYWPVGIGQNARPWLAKHIRTGSIENGNADLRARINIGPEDRVDVHVDSLRGVFSLNDISVSKLNSIPPINHLSAAAKFNENELTFTINSGEAGTLRVSTGSLKVSGIRNKKETLSISGTVQGPIRTTLEFLSHKKLGFLSRLGLSSVGASGTHTTQFEISLPLLDSLKLSDINLTASSDIKDLTLQNVFLGHPISSGNLSLNISNGGLSVAGSIRYAGAPTRLIWIEDFTENTKIQRRIEASLIATSAVRNIIGVEFPYLVQGPLDANVVYEKPHDGRATVSTNLNFKSAKILLPGFKWEKLPGQPASARIDAVLDGHTISSIPFFSLNSDILSISGKLTFSDPSSNERRVIENIVLSHFNLGHTEFTGTIKRTNDRSLLISLSGTSFDATPFFQRKLDQLNLENLTPFSLNANFQNLWIGRGTPINNVNMYLNHDGNHWQKIEIDGELPKGGKALSIKMIPINDGHKLSVYSADAGAILKATDITKSVTGGSIEISGVRKGGHTAPWKGIAEMKRYNLSNAPIFARLMSLASLSGISNALGGKGIKFRLLRLPYQYQNEIVTVRDSLAKGSELGITASGAINFREDIINVNGTIVPAYTLNSFIGKVPIIGPVVGPVLTGEKGGGILAAAYEVKGPLENPEIKLSPLSAFAPGFLRHFFGFGNQEKNKKPTKNK